MNSALKKETIDIKESEYPLINTKLFVPRTKSKIVDRSKLIDQLNNGRDTKLTLISAPAGFGKTTLVSEWISKYNLSAAWISLDQADNDPIRFIHYLIAAFRHIDASTGVNILTFLQAGQKVINDNLLSILVNDISAISANCLLVLDDYHSIDTKEIHKIVELLIEHLPQNISIVITTRVDPPLPVSRLRVRNQLNEIRTKNLSFSFEEANTFFNSLLNLDLSKQDIAILEERTEGWIAGLQLAALSIKGHANVKEFIHAFAGDVRHIVDYLAEEVLNIQTKEIQKFLLQTSILVRLSDSLCDYVLDINESRMILDELEKNNLFIIPLDSKSNWYRYHHLFADLLRQKLYQRKDIDVFALHLKASEWYMQNNQKIEAYHHAMAAKNFDEAANILELAWPEMDQQYQSSVWLKCVRKIPKQIVKFRPVLNVGYAWSLLDLGELEEGEQKLDDAEKCMIAINSKCNSSKNDSLKNKVKFVDEEQFEYLEVSIANARAYYAQAIGEIEKSLIYANKVLEILDGEAHSEGEKASALLGIAYWTNGDLEKAEKYFYDYMIRMRDAGNLVFALMPSYFISYIMIIRGELQKGIELCFKFLESTNEYKNQPILGTADLHLALSELLFEKGDFKEAELHLLKSEEFSLNAALSDWKERFYVIKARFLKSKNNYRGAIDLLEAAKSLNNRTPIPKVRSEDALIARIHIKQGKLTEVSRWLKSKKMNSSDELSYLNEFDYLTLARYLLAKAKKENNEAIINEAIILLERLLQNAKEGRRKRTIIEILVLQSTAYFEQKNTINSTNCLIEALNLAEPENYVGVFLEDGIQTAELLEELLEKKDHLPRSFINNLLTAFKSNRLIKTEDGLVESLSEREHEVLRLIEAGFSNKKIVDKLFISMSTVKTHIRNIFSKLNVHSRTEAIVKAKEVNLI